MSLFGSKPKPDEKEISPIDSELKTHLDEFQQALNALEAVLPPGSNRSHTLLAEMKKTCDQLEATLDPNVVATSKAPQP